MVSRWPAWTFAAGVAAAVGALGVTMIRFPGMFGDAQAGVWATVLGVVMGTYVVVAVVSLVRPVSPALRTGVWFGAAAGVAWLGEIWFQAPAHLPGRLERPAGGLCALVAVAVTIGAGITEGARTGSRARALRSGLWAGLVSGTVMTVGMIAVQLGNVALLGARPDYQDEFVRSGYRDMATYIASDAIAASLMHMVLNVVLGLLGAGVGALLTAARSRRPDTSAT